MDINNLKDSFNNSISSHSFTNNLALNDKLNNNEENIDNNDYCDKNNNCKNIKSNNGKHIKLSNVTIPNYKLQDQIITTITVPVNHMQISNSSVINNPIQYHLKAENGQVMYRLMNVNKDDFPKPNNSLVISESVVSTQNSDQQETSSLMLKRKKDFFQDNLKVRDEKRRATHNEVERRRRDKINKWIDKLSKIVPQCSDESTKQAQSKGGILAKTCEYIQELNLNNVKAEEILEQNKTLNNELINCRQTILNLNHEVQRLKNILKQNGINDTS